MANGLSDILSVYREGLASERQSRLAEQQLALQALQYESAEQFRDETRQREDIMGALEFASTSTKEALGQDTSQIYSKILGLKPIAEANYDETSGAMEKTNKIINKLTSKKYGYSDQDATQLVNIANTYGMASKNPALAQSAQAMASDFGKRVSRDYNIWKESGFERNAKGYQPKSPLMKAMESSGLMYKGGDQLQRDMSIDAFIGVGDALTALDNIEAERLEIGKGDYTLDRPISLNENFKSDIGGGKIADTDIDTDIDFNSLVDEAGINLGIVNKEDGGSGVNIQNEILAGIEMAEFGGDESSVEYYKSHGVTPIISDEYVMSKLDFLPQEEQEKIEKRLSSLNETIADKMVSLDNLQNERNNRLSDFNLMESELEKSEQRLQYFYQLEGREGSNYKTASKDVYKQRSELSNSVEAKEFGVGHHLSDGTYSKEIIELSQEIEGLNIQKYNNAPAPSRRVGEPEPSPLYPTKK